MTQRIILYSLWPPAPQDEHPQKHMRSLGFNLIKSHPYPIGDCWYFITTGGPETFPEYLKDCPDVNPELI